MVTQKIKDFLRLEAASSILLGAMIALAMLAANSPAAQLYEQLHGKGATLVINDGLMALFFLTIGIELKREFLQGELSSWRQAILPVVGAAGGVVVPALIYYSFNAGQEGMRGWAIPMATDIAFTLGLLGLFGSRLPNGLRIFLMALAVIDDLIAIIVIAVFYNHGLNGQAAAFVVGLVGLLLVYGRYVHALHAHVLAGAALWVAMHASGVHATLAGVLLGLIMPLHLGRPLLKRLHGPVAFFIVPVFVFANAGVPLSGLGAEQLTHSVAMGIWLGLFAGKQVGIFTASFLLIKSGLAKLPSGCGWGAFYGACMAAGIGFTMSLFIAALAFGRSELMLEARVGVLTGSLASAAGAAILLAWCLRTKGRA